MNLDELKVQSFVTSFDISEGETAEIKGGYSESCAGGCGGGGATNGCDTSVLQCGTAVYWCGITHDC
jgi:hypothetical protein